MRFLTISKFLLILILPLLIFLLILNLVGFNHVFYQKKFSEYGIGQDVPEAASLHEKVINFIKGKNNELPNEFNEREKQHLSDVRGVIRISTIALYAFIILFVLLLTASAFILKVNNSIVNFVSKLLIFGGFLTVVLATAFFFFISSDFLTAFELIHKLFFENGGYVFDPATDIIVRIYPEQLFMDLGLRISKWIILVSAAAILAGVFLIFKSKNK